MDLKLCVIPDITVITGTHPAACGAVIAAVKTFHSLLQLDSAAASDLTWKAKGGLSRLNKKLT